MARLVQQLILHLEVLAYLSKKILLLMSDGDDYLDRVGYSYVIRIVEMWTKSLRRF